MFLLGQCYGYDAAEGINETGDKLMEKTIDIFNLTFN